ncbi:MAG: hypothetical protein ACOYMA_18480 [Bacteroidia bacterium]
MKKEEVLKEIDDCILNCDTRNLAKNVEELLSQTDEDDACQCISQILLRHYTTYRADATAALMEIIIRKHPNLATIKFPDNYLFRLVILSGSMDLYECYIEEAIEPMLKGKEESDVLDYYMGLYTTAEKYNDGIFSKYVRYIKGMDFNGAFSRYEKDANVAMIHQENYEIMDSIVEKYNSIVGRRDILKNLNKKIRLDLNIKK